MSDPEVKSFLGYGLERDRKRDSAYKSADGRWLMYDRWFTANSDVAEVNLPDRGTTMLASVAVDRFNPVLVASRAFPMGEKGSQVSVLLTFREPLFYSVSFTNLQAAAPVPPASQTVSVTLYTATAAKLIKAVKVKAETNGTVGSVTVMVTRTRAPTTVNVLSSVVTVANAAADGTWYDGTINTANDDLLTGDVVKLEIVFVDLWDGTNLLTVVDFEEA